MGLLAALLIGLAGWLIVTGRLQRMTARDGAALGLAIVGAVLAAKGKPLAGAVPLLISGGFYLWRTRQAKGRASPRPRPVPPRITPADESPTEAAALLGLPIDADPDQIRAAHRRLIATVHPDKGGTEALAAKINAARDVMLRHHDRKE
ncbi:molecular chaperone DnaJ [Sphingobium aquiterrae]|uniref:J domain-containing protein n=1 Tax=Sphingobium aquiterrae TaxID=2038656 RepID=UPI003017471C